MHVNMGPQAACPRFLPLLVPSSLSLLIGCHPPISQTDNKEKDTYRMHASRIHSTYIFCNPCVPTASRLLFEQACRRCSSTIFPPSIPTAWMKHA
ncbi:hypothetical protein M501DRAFT_596058 [Patellaria atrata CBS 101060]|uniref:Secreted protein n=1 Tax=Patellaria atrata CBS 101060 TaxID=1346257 RepID=A0A9P4S1G4_9PEZI|nr:hypothetical protein M501DRAFT_596058 [Patellaria atrata CBS 101060]